MTITRTDRDQQMPQTLFGRDPESIEIQEAVGQQELVNSQVLPTKGSSHVAWGLLGVTFGEVLADDPIFRHATLPDGWKLVATDHAMWSHIVDNKGRVRGGVFYKAAFYDRSAMLDEPHCRYHVTSRYLKDGEYVAVEDRTTGADVFQTPIRPRDFPDGEARAHYAQLDRDRDDAKQWLKNNFPDSANPFAYWD